VSWRINVARYAGAAQNSGQDIVRRTGELGGAGAASRRTDQSLIEQTTQATNDWSLPGRPSTTSPTDDLLAIFTS